MRRPIGLMLCSLSGGLMACGEPLGPITELPRELTVAERHLVQSDNRFAFKLFREIDAQDTTEGNIFISPLSVAMALGMAYNGAAGETRVAMQRALELEDLTLPDVNDSYRTLIGLLVELDPRVEFQIANSLWSRLGIEIVPSFLGLIRQYFDAEAATLDFDDPTASDRINGWVREKTRGRIEEIVPALIPPEVIAYLINAIYFKGDWTHQFDKGRTKNAPFTLATGSQVSVPMMSHEAEVPVRFAFHDGVAVVDLPYGGGAFSMTIALPEDPGDVAALATDLGEDRWNQWITTLDSGAIEVSIPKFTLEYSTELRKVLSALGMEIAFNPDKANFDSLFANATGAYISRVLHKTYVDVHEEGTEAAAVTVVEFRDRSGPPSIVVNRPFLFAIRERFSGAILFMGKIMNPTAT